MAYRDEVLADTPWVYCELESVGSTTPDTSGNGRTVTFRSANFDGLVTGIVGNGTKANESDSSGTFIPQTQVANPLSVYSVEVWFKSTVACHMVWRGQLSDPNNWDGAADNAIWVTTAGNVELRGWSTSGGAYRTATTSGTDYRDGEWHHVVATESSTNGKRIYVDGVLGGTGTFGQDTSLSASYMRFGGGYDGGMPGYATGASRCPEYIDECAFYTTELTAGRILAHYEAVFPSEPPPDLVRYHPTRSTTVLR